MNNSNKTDTDKIINISSDNISGNCDFKCSYSHNYVENNLVAKNEGDMILLTNDTIQPVVTYNNNNYMLSSIIIVSPSLHKFENSKTDGEILIEHVPVSGGKHLFVCIPLINSSNLSNASVLLTLTIDYVFTNAPNNGNTVNLNIANFNLNTLVPNEPFYSYTGKDMNNYDSDFIVFDIKNAIPLNNNTFNSLTQMITPLSSQMTGTQLFYNKLGKNTIESNASTSSTTTPSDKKIKSTFDVYSVINSDYFITIVQIIINFIFILLLLFILNYLFTYITSIKKNKIPYQIPLS